MLKDQSDSKPIAGFSTLVSMTMRPELETNRLSLVPAPSSPVFDPMASNENDLLARSTPVTRIVQSSTSGLFSENTQRIFIPGPHARVKA